MAHTLWWMLSVSAHNVLIRPVREMTLVAALLLTGMLVSCGGAPAGTSAPAGGDITLSTVGITFPASGHTVSGSINVTATAAANGGVAGVQFQFDSVDVGAEDTTDPYA